MESIKNVVFDLGGVLVPLDMERCIAAFRHLGMDAVAELINPCYPAEMLGRLEHGDITFHETCDEMRRLSNRPDITDEQIAELEARKQEYKDNGITHYRPWLFVLTDGYPTDTNLEAGARSRLQEYISRKKVNYIPMGIGDADIEHLKSYYPDTVQNKVVLTASKENFKDAFVWLSDSMVSTSKSDPNLGSISSAPLPQTISLGL